MRIASILFQAMLVMAVAACTQTPDEHHGDHDSAVMPVREPVDALETRTDLAGTRMVIHKTPGCDCCTAWAGQAAAAGFAVELRNSGNLHPVKQELDIPPAQGSCHTAEVDGYFVEGHVPFDEIKRLLAERPRARGLTVPGMPLGSPGMEADVNHIYSVNLVYEDGRIEEYARYRGNVKLRQ